MNKQSLVTFAAAALIAGVSVASAAPGTISTNVHGLQPSDRLDLSQSQQQTAWNDLYMGSLIKKRRQASMLSPARACRTAW